MRNRKFSAWGSFIGEHAIPVPAKGEPFVSGLQAGFIGEHAILVPAKGEPFVSGLQAGFIGEHAIRSPFVRSFSRAGIDIAVELLMFIM